MDNFQTFSQFLDYIESNYDEDQIITIENFMSYYINEYRGFGKHNCKNTYEDDIKSDTTCELHKISIIGFEFEKKIHDERKYKKSSHFRDMLNMSNKPNNILPYTDKQFEEDLKKWLSETKIIQNDKVNKFIEHLK